MVVGGGEVNNPLWVGVVNSPLRGGGEKKTNVESKNIKTTPSAPTASTVGTYPIYNQSSRMPQH